MGTSFKSGLLCRRRRYEVIRFNVSQEIDRPTSSEVLQSANRSDLGDLVSFFSARARRARFINKLLHQMPRVSLVGHDARVLFLSCSGGLANIVVRARESCVKTSSYAYMLLQKSVKRRARTPRR